MGEKRKYCKMITNSKTEEIKYIRDGENIPDGFELGLTRKAKEKIKERFTGDLWYTDKRTGISFRSKEILNNEFYERKRIFKNVGFEKANSLYNVVDLFNRISTKVDIIDKRIHAPQSGTSSEKTKIFIFNNMIFSSVKLLSEYCKGIGVFIPNNSNFVDKIITTTGRIFSDEAKSFKRKNKGKYYHELGFKCISLVDFDNKLLNSMKIYWREDDGKEY